MTSGDVTFSFPPRTTGKEAAFHLTHAELYLGLYDDRYYRKEPNIEVRSVRNV